MGRLAQFVTLVALLLPACGQQLEKKIPTNGGQPDVGLTDGGGKGDAATEPDASSADASSADVSTQDTTIPGAAPELRVEPTDLRFEVEVGATATESFSLQNRGGSDLTLTELQLVEETLSDVGAEFTLELGWDDALTLAPNETVEISVAYAPRDEGQDRGYVEVRTNDPAYASTDGRVRVPIVGETSCSAASARVAGTTVWTTSIAATPLQTVELRSEVTDGDSYEWSILQQPTNSTTRLSPNSTVAEPSLFLDLAGDYVIELTAFGDDGVARCGLITIVAAPDQDFHVQLVWDTPADADQTDTHGTDLDLHFLHPLGRWNQAPYDIFYFNATADWGEPGPHDDPSLDIDDVDGAGPENINMDNPESGRTYSVGVYYYADNAFGPSYATVRLFVRGVQAYEYRDMELEGAGTFWNVATIGWPAGNVTATNVVGQGFPGN